MKTIQNYLTIDVEDYFQVSAFENIISHQKWDNFPFRVENNTKKILDILVRSDTRATFFVLGWVAEKFPALIKEISDQDHEIGCHSYYHRLVYALTPREFKEDARRAKNILEELTGKKVCGYRAPSYSITRRSLWALDILAELGFEYDSSIFPIHHDRYGIPDAPRFPFLWDLSENNPKILDESVSIPQPATRVLQPEVTRNLQPVTRNIIREYPISTATFGGLKLPVAGGGYFRFFPYWFTRMTLKRINQKEGEPFMFYLHPWEIDPGQPWIKKASQLSRFRHYNNLDKTEERLNRLLGDFDFGPVSGPSR